MNNSYPMEVLQQWLNEPETQEKLHRCIQQAIENLKSDTSLRIPRTETERQGAFRAWLTSYRLKLGPEIQEQFRQQFPGISQRLKTPNTIKSIIETYIWPDIEVELRSYAVRGLASDWVRSHMGDAVLVGMPDFRDDAWNVPLAVANVGENLGYVCLDSSGSIIESLTSSRATLLKAVHDRKLPAVAAAAG